MICGVDEAGRGPVMGPLVVCGICIEDDQLLRDMGVKDSKKLTRSKRESLHEKLGGIIGGIEIIEVSAEEIDLLREEMTMNELEVRIFASVISKLRPSVAYVDSADVNEERFGREIQSQIGFETQIISKHRADENYPVVSTASIFAKIRRDRSVREIEMDIGEPIGSGYPSDPNTIRFLESWLQRYDVLPPHTRRSWDTCSRLIRMKSLKRIDEF